MESEKKSETEDAMTSSRDHALTLARELVARAPVSPTIDVLARALIESEAECEITIKALVKYGRHDAMTCKSISLTMAKVPVPNGRRCDCGLDAALRSEEAPDA